MGRPKGSKNRIVNSTVPSVETVTRLKHSVEKIEEKSNVNEKEEIQESQKAELLLKESHKVEPAPAKSGPPDLPPGQKYFEAPDGTLLVGEADKQQLWCRSLNGGKGGWINPRRG